MTHLSILFFFFSSRRRHTRCALVTGVQTCALPISLSLRRRPDDAERLHRLHAIARAAGVGSVATGDVLYHAPEARPLQDVMTATREKATIDERSEEYTSELQSLMRIPYAYFCTNNKTADPKSPTPKSCHYCAH